jgi:hypothetical protein
VVPQSATSLQRIEEKEMYVVTEPLTGIVHRLYWPADPEPWSCSCGASQLLRSCYASHSIMHSFMGDIPCADQYFMPNSLYPDLFIDGHGNIVDMDGKC